MAKKKPEVKDPLGLGIKPTEDAGTGTPKPKAQTEPVPANKKPEVPQVIVVSGESSGYFRYGDVERQFERNNLAVIRSDGAILIMSNGNTMKPICYIEGGADIAMARNLADADMEVSAIADDGREILISFTKMDTLTGLSIPNEKVEKTDMATMILKVVKNASGMYGRHTISRILTGSASRKVLTLKLSTLALYGVLHDKPFKDVLDTVDALIEEGLLEVIERDEFRVLQITKDGEEAIKG